MKIMKLENDRIKVVLSDNDLIKLDVNFENISPESPEMSIFLTKILKAIGDETGIVIDEGQILIEAGKEGDCVVLIISKAQHGFSLGKRRKLKTMPKSDRIIFEISAFDELFMMLANVNEKVLERMRVYRYNTSFYLSVPKFPITASICEFSRRCRKNHVAEAFLSEHGKLIAQNEQVVKMAKEIKRLFRY